jgi:hypothetical protein
VSAQLDNARVDPQRFAVLRLAHVALLVPLNEVHSLELLSQIDTERRNPSTIGSVRVSDTWLPVLSLSDDLAPESQSNEPFRICAILASADNAIAIACREIVSVDAAAIVHHAIPPSMRTANSPIQALVRHGDEVFCRTSAADLARLLDSP